MKKYLFLLIFLPSSLFAISQQRFEGIIDYRVHNDSKKMDTSALRVYFGKNAIKLIIREDKKTDSEQILILIDSATTYILDTIKNTYSQKKLHRQKNIQPVSEAKPKLIAGHGASPLTIRPETMLQLFRFNNPTTIQAYLADNLYYTIPLELAANPEFAMIFDGRILLSVDFYLSESYYGWPIPEDSEIPEDHITAEAYSIRPMHLDNAVFQIPPGYILESETFRADSAIIFDSTIWEEQMKLDTMSIMEEPTLPPPPPPPVRKAPNKPGKLSKTSKGDLKNPEE